MNDVTRVYSAQFVFFLVNRGVFGASCCLGENLQYFAVEYEMLLMPSSFAHTAMTLLPSEKNGE